MRIPVRTAAGRAISPVAVATSRGPWPHPIDDRSFRREVNEPDGEACSGIAANCPRPPLAGPP